MAADEESLVDEQLHGLAQGHAADAKSSHHGRLAWQAGTWLEVRDLVSQDVRDAHVEGR